MHEKVMTGFMLIPSWAIQSQRIGTYLQRSIFKPSSTRDKNSG